MTVSTKAASLIVPILRYRDIGAAIDWLCQTFGFEEHFVVRDDRGELRYAQLTFGDGLVMLGTVEDDASDSAGMTTRSAPAGAGQVQTPYVFVADIVAHHRRAEATGADIVFGLDGVDGEGRGYSCRDPEGHIWNFGTYDPWKGSTARAVSEAIAPQRRRVGRRVAVTACLLLVAAGSFAAFSWADGSAEQAVREIVARAAKLVAPDGAQTVPATAKSNGRDPMRRMLERDLQGKRLGRTSTEGMIDARAPLAQANSGADEAQGSAPRAEQVAETADQDAAALAAAKERERKLAAEQAARAAESSRVAKEAQDRLVQERNARVVAERAVREARESATLERKAKEAAERAAKTARDELAQEKAASKLAEERASKATRLLAAREQIARRAAQRLADESRRPPRFLR